jgi:glyoxylase-like metal-dependent hydrolase (beta-lactamase superfamily II)
MEVHELAPGFWYWLAAHPKWEPGENWPEEVLCVYYESADGVVLIDPQLPRADEVERFWRALDRDVKRAGGLVHVLLTGPWHDRSTANVVARYGASVWAHPDADWADKPDPTTTRELPAGVEALLPEGNAEGQAFFFIREHRTLVTGDMFSGTGGSFHVFVSPEEPNPEAFLAWLPRLLDLPIERVLIAHGEPILSDGGAAIERALESH